MMLRRLLMILTLLAVLCGREVARADNEPAIVVPGRPDVPVIINGRDARGAVVIGDWGLYRPHMGVTVIYRQPWPVFVRYRYRHHHRRVVRYHRRHAAPVRRCRCGHVKVAPRAATVSVGRRHYFPSGTSPPVLGRLESEEKGEPPVPAESFSRSWSAGSRPAPATIAEPPAVVPPVVLDNRFRPRRPVPTPPREPPPPQPPRR